MFQEMVQEPAFVLDEGDELMCLDTARIISSDTINLKYLLAIFNSRLFFYAMKAFYGGGALGSTGIRMKHTFMAKFPIFPLDCQTESALIELVDIVVAHHDTKDAMKQIDQLIFKIYKLDNADMQAISSSLSL
jgi:hypothetical protein